jgi:hypothetical protein
VAALPLSIVDCGPELTIVDSFWTVNGLLSRKVAVSVSCALASTNHAAAPKNCNWATVPVPVIVPPPEVNSAVSANPGGARAGSVFVVVSFQLPAVPKAPEPPRQSNTSAISIDLFGDSDEGNVTLSLHEALRSLARSFSSVGHFPAWVTFQRG